jgi:2-succinyl-5-enolpyruvyl-6-hydroxy-3-cyclohexene-1-carboxylate synthase
VVVDAGERWRDHDATATTYVRADPGDTLTKLARRTTHVAADGWIELWRTVERAALAALGSVVGPSHEGDVWAAVLPAVPPEGALFVSSSMPVRDLDAFGHPAEGCVHVLGNRGASGIDGVVSTAFGVASQRSGPTVCVVGDVAFFHDQNGLLWSREDDARVLFVLIDNDGGGIFHALPVARHEPHFTELFATPHGLDLRHSAELHGLEVADVTIETLSRSLAEAIAAGGTRVLRVRTERAQNQLRHAEIAEAVGRSVREALG